MKASYQDALWIAQKERPYTVAADLMLPVVNDMYKTVFGNDERGN